MPAKNAIKTYVENGYYHIYNRGVDKRLIFQDGQDYAVFRSYLKEYLQPKDEVALSRKAADLKIPAKEKNKILRSLQLNNYSQHINLLAYTLMPNHFHFFLKQKSPDAIGKFMSSLCTRYSTYFNRKYNRTGALFQGVYKAVLIDNEAQYIHISRYIHHQAISAYEDSPDQPSSYPEYISQRSTDWVHPEEIMALFPGPGSAAAYAKFVAEYQPSTFTGRVLKGESLGATSNSLSSPA
ncbi:MAG TPA: transposase [Dehalococcoidales bacterium]|nr:transposase [Dehalococcoidales bacterium]